MSHILHKALGKRRELLETLTSSWEPLDKQKVDKILNINDIKPSLYDELVFNILENRVKNVEKCIILSKLILDITVLEDYIIDEKDVDPNYTFLIKYMSTFIFIYLKELNIFDSYITYLNLMRLSYYREKDISINLTDFSDYIKLADDKAIMVYIILDLIEIDKSEIRNFLKLFNMSIQAMDDIKDFKHDFNSKKSSPLMELMRLKYGESFTTREAISYISNDFVPALVDEIDGALANTQDSYCRGTLCALRENFFQIGIRLGKLV